MTDIKAYRQAVSEALDAMKQLSCATEWLKWNGLPELITELKIAADALDKGRINVALRRSVYITNSFNSVMHALGEHPYSKIVNKSFGFFLDASISQGDVFADTGKYQASRT